NTILKKDSEHILLGTETGLFLYNTTLKQLKPIKTPIQNGEISGLFIWDENQVLVTAANRNYLINDAFECKEIRFLDEKGKSIGTTIRSVKKDIQGGIWLGTEGRGVL